MADNERHFWFVTRPVRDPQYHEDALQCLQEATNDFTVKWTGNREAHKKYEQALADAGMKQNNVSKSGSGGRTWAAMLKTYNYVFENSDGFLKPTKVGRAILNGQKVPENIKKQVMTLQIPNAYFLSSRFRPKYSDEYQIQPIIFLLRLVNDARLDKQITNEEITLFAMTAVRDSDYEGKVKEILEYRQLDADAKEQRAKEIFAQNGDLSRADSKPDFSKYDSVATTFTILCRFTEFAEQINGGLKGCSDPEIMKDFEPFCARYPFNKRIFTDPDFYVLSAGLDVDTYKTQYGVAAKPASRTKKRAIKVQQVLSRYPSPEELTVNQLVTELKAKFNTTEAKQIAEEVKAQMYNATGDAFLENYRHEEDNLEFERETAHVAEGLGLTVEMHPKPTSDFNNGNEDIDIMGTTPDGKLILIDAKNYAEKFQLSAGLRNKMATSYLRGYMGYNGKNPHYYCYVTAAKSATTSNLLKINELAKRDSGLEVHGMMISATAIYYLQKYFVEKKLSAEKRAEMFLRLFNDDKYESFVRVAEVLGIDDYGEL